MRFNNIQVLRLFAATCVVLYHLGVHAPNLIGVGRGWLLTPLIVGFPVPLFFAVSGFVLTHAVQNASTGRFLAARILRLYPGYWLALAATLVIMRSGTWTELQRWLIYFVTPEQVALWPSGGRTEVLYFLGVEWSLVYEVFLSLALTVLAAFGSRRVLPLLTTGWLAFLIAKAIAWPNAYFDQFPHWSMIALSGFNVPFVLGVLAYYVKDADRRWAWAVVPLVLSLLYVNSTVLLGREENWIYWGLAGAGTVWLATKLPQLPDRNPLVRLGDCTYGLFLFHVPLMFSVLYPASRLGGVGNDWILLLAGSVAIIGGLCFGRVEAELHSRLRPLAKWNPEPLLRRVRGKLASLKRHVF
jgi:peptidoglycan/LPS O-acetylase OafA/YrhL